jgi:alpha-glucosidase
MMDKLNRIPGLSLIILWSLFPFLGFGVKTLTVSSPSKNLKMDILGVPEGLQLTLSGPQNLKMTIDAFGFVTNKELFPSGCVISRVKQGKVNDQWEPVYGERKRIPDRYRQAIITLCDKANSALKMEVICRIYDEGVAFRYRFPDNHSKGMNIEKELTAIRFEGNYEAWASSRAQSIIEKTTLDKITSEVERSLLVNHNDSSWLALGEAGLVDFARMKFIAAPEQPGRLQAQLSGPVDLDQAGHISPWRYVMVAGSPGKLLENNYFILNLNEPNQIKDVSWIKPGIVIREVTLTTQGGLACVDFATKHRIDYVEFDAGWYGPETDPRSDANSGLAIFIHKSRNP